MTPTSNAEKQKQIQYHLAEAAKLLGQLDNDNCNDWKTDIEQTAHAIQNDFDAMKRECDEIDKVNKILDECIRSDSSSLKTVCEKNAINYEYASLYRAKVMSPNYCRYCKYIESYSTLYPCRKCIQPGNDLYEKEDDDEMILLRLPTSENNIAVHKNKML